MLVNEKYENYSNQSNKKSLRFCSFTSTEKNHQKNKCQNQKININKKCKHEHMIGINEVVCSRTIDPLTPKNFFTLKNSFLNLILNKNTI